MNKSIIYRSSLLPLGEGKKKRCNSLIKKLDEGIWVSKFVSCILLFYLVLVTCILGFAQCASAATWLDPSLKWRTVETPHFSIHFHQGEEEIAKKLAPIAEEIHVKLVKFMQYKIGMKTDVVLVDNTDTTNGMATVIPNPVITLYIADMSSNLNPYTYDVWLKYVFTHEYTHILHLDIASTGANFWRMLFGRVIFPNGIEPSFMVEGMAVYSETKNATGGRINNPRWQAMLRMDILEDNIKTIDQAANTVSGWPEGNVFYLYGMFFLQYVADKYGEDKIIQIAHNYGDFLLFGDGLYGAFKAIIGKDVQEVWNEWLADYKIKFNKQKQQAEKEGLTHLEKLTTKGYYITKPKWSKDGQFIYYNQQNADEYPQIRRINVSQKQDEKILEGLVFDDNYSVNSNGKQILFSKSNIYKNYYYYKDLFIYDLSNKRLARLTSGERASDPAWSPDSKHLAYIKNNLGTRFLIVDNKVTTFEPDAQCFSPSWSPDSKKIVLSKKLPSNDSDLYIYDLETNAFTLLFEDNTHASEANPCFSPDGKYVIFDSDRTGIVNIYAYSLEEDKLYKVSNVIGGASMPDVSSDSKQVALIDYSSKGYNLAVMEYTPEKWKEVRVEDKGEEAGLKMEKGKDDGMGIIGPSPNPSKQSFSVHDYNPLPTLFPKFWLPDTYYNENGPHTSFFTMGTDALYQHSISFLGGYDDTARRWDYTINYVNDQFPPQLNFSFSNSAQAYSVAPGTFWLNSNHAYATAAFIKSSVFSEYDAQAIYLGAEQHQLTNISAISDYTGTLPSFGNIRGVSLGYRYLNARQYSLSISPEDGIDFYLRTTRAVKSLTSDYSYHYYYGFLKAYYPLYAHQVLAFESNGFLSEGDQIAQGGYTWKYFDVRGYSSTVLYGRKGAVTTLEYRFPLAYIDRGPGLGDTFFRRLWGSLFVDYGGVARNDLKLGVGGEMSLSMIFAYGYYGLDFTLGYAKGLSAGGEDRIYFKLTL